jgi:hypothetical protein
VKIEQFATADEIIMLPGRYRAWFAFATSGSIGFHVGLVVPTPIPGSPDGATRPSRLRFGTFEVHHPCNDPCKTRIRFHLSGAEDLASSSHEQRWDWCNRALTNIFSALAIEPNFYEANFAFSTEHITVTDAVVLHAHNVA